MIGSVRLYGVSISSLSRPYGKKLQKNLLFCQIVGQVGGTNHDFIARKIRIINSNDVYSKRVVISIEFDISGNKDNIFFWLCQKI